MDRLIQETIMHIKSSIEGRMCDEANDNLYLGRAILEATDGNHLEIGSLFGGSAIFAALLKKALGFKCHVYAIDPFSGYYLDTVNDQGQKIGGLADPFSTVPVSLETAMRNAEKFGVSDRITFIQALSYPFPEQLKYETFATAYIDGDHWNLAPTLDWLSVKDITTKLVIFDNNDGRIGVDTACKVAASSKGWREYWNHGITYIVRKDSWYDV